MRRLGKGGELCVPLKTISVGVRLIGPVIKREGDTQDVPKRSNLDSTLFNYHRDQ